MSPSAPIDLQFQTHNPWTGNPLKVYSYTPAHQLESFLERSTLAQLAWKRKPVRARYTILAGLSEKLRQQIEPLSQSISNEMGKPILQARAEIAKSASVISSLCENAEDWLKDEEIQSSPDRKLISHQPLGTIMGIMPWNFPVWQSLRFAVPALIAGNTVLLKPAENTFGTATLLDELVREVTNDLGLYQTFCVPHSSIESLIADDRISAVSLTGSTRAGRAIAAQCGKALKKCVLELGGNDALVVLEDADLKAAASIAAQARLVNSGQSCVAAKRFVVVESVYAEFLELLRGEWKKATLGDPSSTHTTVGPMARQDLQKEVLRQIRTALDFGAKFLAGGPYEKCSSGYAGVTPVLLEVQEDNPVLEEEIFGPVGLVLAASDLSSAIRLANASRYGLGSAIFTKNIELAQKLAREDFESGMCTVNDQTISEAHLPFGGIKNSGFGKELGRAGLLEFVNSKSIRIKS